MMKELILIRHGKSSWDSGAASDFARPLSNRGVDDSKKLGRFVSEKGWEPRWVVASSALRASTTCDLICREINVDSTRIWYDRRVYDAGVQTLLNVIGEIPNMPGQLFLIGHNPAMEQLLLHLCPDVEPMENGKLFTTANLARVELPGRWDKIEPGSGVLLDLIRPGDLS